MNALTSKQRAYLISLGHSLDPVFQIGKSSLTPEIITALDEVLEKRELVKVSVLKNCSDNPRDLGEIISERTHSQVVHVIGKKIVLYRKSKKKPKIELPCK